MVVEHCTGSCTASRRTGFVYMGCNMPWEADSPARLAERRQGEVQVPPAVVVAAVAAAAAVVAAAAAAVAGAQANFLHRHVAHCVLQTRQSAVGYMSHKSSKSRATDSPH